MTSTEKEYEKTSYSTVGGRLAKRAIYDKETVHSVINSALVVNVAFIDEEGLPAIIPMNGQIEEDEDGHYVLLHGYQNGRFIKHCSQPNTRLVVSATQVHARVIGLAAKAHSYNYLSAVVHGYADEPIDKRDLVTKRILSEKIVNHLVPGRWEEVRKPNDNETYDVGFIKMRIETASAKQRDAMPGDYAHDIENEELRKNVWAGIIPIRQVMGTPQPAPYNLVDKPKNYWKMEEEP